MNSRTNRRHFLQTTALAGAGFWVAGRSLAQESRSANEKINFACIGVGGKGSSDMSDAAKHGNIVAICDIDENNLAKAAQAHPKAKKYHDFRKMLEEMGKEIDAVTVSTPDHTHAVAAAMAMRMGKHCFCQKPLTHTIYEARRLGELARENKVATQMGNQGTALRGLRTAAALLKGGAIGNVKEVHVWTNRPIWPQGGAEPKPAPVPDHVHWDEWLGPAEDRPYAPGYHPFSWRGFWDFGTGALGDMACHTMNMPFMGLDLRNPTSVQAETSGHNKIQYPKWSIITYQFPKTDDRDAVVLYWYDGGKRPPLDLFEGERRIKESGSLIVGDKGKIYSPDDYGAEFRLMGAEQKDVEIEESPGHFDEFARAIRGGEQARSNFPEYASPLTETVLLGNLAVWADGEKIEWDAENLKAKGREDLDELIKPSYREGWTEV